jgi:cell division protein FtsA
MAKKQVLTAIDVGTTKVCTLVGEVAGDGDIRVLGVGITPSGGMHKAMVVNIDEAKDAIRESIKKAEQTSGLRIESAYVGVTGRHIASMNNHGVVAITRQDRMVRTDDLKRVLDSARNVKIPTGHKLLHAIPRAYAVDGQPGVKNPVGMYGYRLDVETHIITAATTAVQNLVKCVRGVGVDIDELVLEPIASAEAVLSEEEKEMGIVLADIGGGTTDICVFKEGSIWHTAVLPVAGYQMTRDIAIGLGLPFDVAEEMKKRYGSVMPIHEVRDEELETISRDGHGVSYQELCDIVRARVDEILRLILLELPQSNYETIVPAGLVLTGGSSNLPGIDLLGREILRLPVRVGVPQRVGGINDMLDNPAYATAVGLVLWADKNRNAAKKRSRFNFSFKNIINQLTRFFR